MAARVSETNRTPARSRLRSETSRQVIATLISTGMVLQPIAAAATPTGGTVVAGNATIDTTGNVTNIEQIDARVVIDWESFDIDAGESVRFQQPGTGAVALNRVFNELPTHIRGQLLANGHVWIVNRHGITFHAGSVVDTGGLLATTADIPNADFMAGSNRFTIPGEDGATVINNGSISFGQAGLAGLVAPGAQNNGQIVGQMGSVIVAGERTFAIDFAGDGMFAFEPLGAAGGGGRVLNTGTISNNGGYILIAARTASGMVDESVSLGGLVEANTAEMRNGRIVLSAGDGLANVTGTLSATGGTGERGGSVQVSGGRVNLDHTARVDVSGGTGGGTAEIGGGYQGASMGADFRNAQDTRVQAGAVVAADALDTGDGGTAVIWADGSTGYAGTITARGGAQSGNGGTVEVSGLQTLGFYGTVDTSAANGHVGTLLLDPTNIVVRDQGLVPALDPVDDDALDAGNTPPAPNDGAGFIGFAEGGANDFVITPDAIDDVNALVTLQASNDITFQDNLDLEHDLTAQAGNDINVNAAINIVGAGGADGDGNLVLEAASASAVDDMGDPSTVATGTINFGGSGTISANDVTLRGGTADMTLGAVTATGALNVTTAGALLQAGGTAVSVAGTTDLDAGANAITLESALNDFNNDDAGDGRVTASGDAITLRDADAIDLGNIDAGGDLDVMAGGAITQTVAGGAMAGDAVNVAGTTDLDAGANAITLDSALNDFNDDDAGDGRVAASGSAISLRDADAIELGDIDATGDLDVTAGGAITQTPAGGNAGDGINVTLTTDLDAGAADITLESGLNDFGGVVTADGNDIALTDTNDLTVGTINALVDGADNGGLKLDAGAALGQDGGSVITVVGASELDAVTGITLDQGNDFQANIQADTSGADAPISLSNGSTNTLIVRRADAGTAGDRGDVTLTGANGVRMEDIDAATLIVTATADDITDSGGGAADFAINAVDATLTATAGNITLDEAENDFTGTVDAAAINIAVEDASAIDLGNIDAGGDLDVMAGGAITQTVAGGAMAGDAVNVAGTTDLDAGANAITLDSALNDFNDDDAGDGRVAASGSAISLRDADAIELGDIDATGDLDVTAGGAITQTPAGGNAGDGINVTLTTDLDAGTADITLESGLNDFGGVVTADANDIALTDTNDLTVGTINALADGGDNGGLTLDAGAALGQDGGSVITVEGASELDAVTGITLDQGNDFQANIQADTSGAGAPISLSNGSTNTLIVRRADAGTAGNRGDVTLTGANGVRMEDIDAATLIVTATADDITDSGGGAADFAINAVDATLTATAGNITLDEAENDFTGTVDAAAINIAVEDASAIDLGNIDAGGDLDVMAGGAITQTVAGGAMAGDAVNVTGTTDLDAGANAITLDSALNDFNDDDAGDGRVAASGSAISLRDADAIELGDIDATGDLDVTAGGAITQTVPGGGPGADIDVGGTADLDAGANDISLASVDNDFTGAVDADGAMVEITDTNDLTLGTINSDGGLTATADGALTVTEDLTDTTGAIALTADSSGDGAENLVLTGGTTLDAGGSLTLAIGAGGGGEVTGVVGGGGEETITLNTGDNLILPAMNLTALDLTIDAAGTVTQTARLLARDLDVTAEAGMAGQDITLDQALNDFTGTVNADGAMVEVIDTNDLTLGTINSDGGLTATADGTLTVTEDLTDTTGAIALTADSSGDGAENLVLTGGATLDAGGSLTLAIGAGGGGEVTGVVGGGGEETITLNTGDNLILPAMNLTALDLTIDAAGTVTQTARLLARDLDVTAEAGMAAQDITLDQALNDFTGTVALDGGIVVINDTSDLTLNAVSSDGGLTATSDGTLTVAQDLTDGSGNISLTADNDLADDMQNLVIEGGTTINAAGTLALDIGGTGVLSDNNVGGDVTLITGAGFDLPETVFTAADLIIDAVGAIGQEAGTTALLNNLTAITNGAAIDFSNLANRIDTFTADSSNAGNAAPAAVSVADASGLTLGNIDATDLTITTGGAVTQITDNAVPANSTRVSASGTTTFVDDAGDGAEVTLGSTDNDLETVTGTVASIDLTETDGVTITTLTANAGDADITSDADVQVQTSLSATGDASLTSTTNGTITFDPNATLTADSNTSGAGDASLTSDGGTVTAGAGSAISGVNATISGGDTTTAAVAATGGDVDIDATVGSATLNGATTATAGVTVDAETNAAMSGGGSAGTTLAMTAQDVDLSGATFTATNGTTLTNGAGDDTQLGGAEDAGAGSETTFEVDEAGLNILAGGPITVDSGAGAITSGGAVDLTSAGASDLILDGSGGAGDVTVGNLTVDNLIVQSGTGTTDIDGTNVVNQVLSITGNAVSQDAGDSIDVTGTTDIVAAATVALDGTANEFIGDVSIDGTAVSIVDESALTLRDVNATTLSATAATDLTLGDIDATTSLTATATNGSITDTDTDNEMIVTPAATFSAAAGNVTLDNDPANVLRAHDFGTVNVTAAMATVLNDLNGLILGDVTTDALQVLALGAIGSTGTVAVTNDTTLQTETADGSGTINVTGAFGGTVSANTDANGDGDRAAVTLTDTDADLTLGNVTATNATITSNGAGGIDAMVGVQSVSGTATYNAAGGDVDLSNAANTFDGIVNVDSDTDNSNDNGLVTLRDADSITLGDVNADALAVTALAGDIIDDGTAAGDVQVDGDASLTATGGLVRLDDANNDFGGSVDASGTLVRLTDTNAIQLGAVTSAGTLRVDAGGDITDTMGDVIDVEGISILNAAGSTIELDESHDFTGRVDATGATVTLNDVDSLILGEVTATTLNATAVAGSITDAGGTRAIMAGTATLTAAAGEVDIDTNDLHDFDTVSATGQSVTIDDVDDLILGRINATAMGGVLDVDAGGAITQTAGMGAGTTIDVAGSTDLNAGTNDITLGSADNDFVGAVTAEGGAVTLTDANDLQLAEIDVTTLSATSQTGSISDTDGEFIRASEATFEASAGDVTLDNDPAQPALHNFGTVNVTDAGITTIRDRNSVALGSVTTDSLNVEAQGAITDTDGDAIAVTGTTVLDAGTADITLDNVDTHDFSDALGGGAFVATGGDVTVDDQTGIQLGAIDADSLTVRAGGAVTQNNIASVTGDVDIDNAGADVTLLQANAIGGTIDIEGANVALTNNQDTTLGDIDATGNLTVSSGGLLTDDGAGNAPDADVNVGGETTLSASTTITLDDSGNNFDADGVGDEAVNATGTEVTLVDEDTIRLGAVTTTALDVTANGGGDILDTAAVIDADDAVLTADGSIILDTGHDLDTVIADAEVDVTLNDIDALSLDGITAGGAVDIDAGSLTVTQDITAGGAADLTTTAANMTTGDIVVDGGRTIRAGGLLAINPAMGGTLTDGSAMGGDTITLISGEGFVLPATNLTVLNLDILANGIGDDVTQTVGSTVLGTLDIRTSGGDVLLQQANDFGLLRADTTEGGQTASAVRVTENDGDPADGLTLGTIVASELEIAADGTIDDVAGMDAANAITASGTTTLTATDGGDVLLDNMFHDFGGAVTVAEAANVTLADVNDLLVARLAGNGTATLLAKQDLTITGVVETMNGALGLTADSDGNDSGSITVDAGGSINAGTGALTTSAALRTILRDTTAGSLTVTETTALRFETGTTAIGGNVIVTAGTNVTDASDSTLTVAGTTDIGAGGRVMLDSVTNDFDDNVTVATGATEVAITDANNLNIGGIDSSGEITLDSGGTLLVFGDVTADDDSITMTATDTVGFGANVDAGTGPVTITAENGDFGMLAGTTLTAGDLRVDAGIDAVLAETITDSLTITAGETVETIAEVSANAGDATIEAGDDILLGDRLVTSGTGALTAGTDGTGAIEAVAGTEIVATDLDATAADSITLAEVRADDVDLTTTNTAGVGAGAITLADGRVLVRNDLTVTSAGTVSDTGTGSVVVLGDAVLSATGQTVDLDNAGNDFRGTVRALAETLNLVDRNSLSVVDTDVTGASTLTANNIAVGQSVLGDAMLNAVNSVDLDDVAGDAVTVVAGGPVDVARFDVTSISIDTADAITLSQGVAAASVALTGGGNVTASTVQTSSLTATDMGRVTLDRVGSDTAALQITADDIRLGRVVAASADLQAMAGSIRTMASTATTEARITGPDGATRLLDTDDVAGTARLLEIDGPLSVGATGEVRLTEAENNGTVVNNRLTNVIVDEEIAGALVIDTDRTIDITSNSTVGSLTVRGEQNIRADVDVVTRAGNPDADGNARIESTTTARNASLTGSVEGDATAVAMGDALIDGIVGGSALASAGEDAAIVGNVGINARAEAGTNAAIDGTVGGNATAEAGRSASIGRNQATTITGNATATGGLDATINSDVGGQARAEAGRDATIDAATIGGAAIADAGRNAMIDATIGGDATATAQTSATIGGAGSTIVGGSASATARDGDAAITGFVNGNATAGASTGDDATITGYVRRRATATAAGTATIIGDSRADAMGVTMTGIGLDAQATSTADNASIVGPVARNAVVSAEVDATIDGAIGNNATAGAGNDATILGTVGSDTLATAGGDATINSAVDGDATAIAGNTAEIGGVVLGNAMAVAGQNSTTTMFSTIGAGGKANAINAGAGMDAIITGDVAGDATLDAMNDATISGNIGGNASATAGNDADIDGTIGGDATAAAGNNAEIDGMIGGDATATAGENAAIGAQAATTVDGSATADATNGAASIIGTVGVDASTSAGTDALIDGDVTGNAMADAGNDATVTGTVGGDVSANAGNDADVDGMVGGDAALTAGNNAEIDGMIGGDATATAGENVAIGAQAATTVDGSATADAMNGAASIIGTVGVDASTSAGTDALIDGDVTGNAMADAGNDATVTGTVGGDVSANAGNNIGVDGTVGGDVFATAGGDIVVDGDITRNVRADAGQSVSVDGTVGLNVTADAGQSASIGTNRATTVAGNATARTDDTNGLDAIINSDVGGQARAEAGQDAIIDVTTVGGAAIAEAGRNALIDGTIGANATASAGTDATIGGGGSTIVEGSATATALGGDASITGFVDGNARADASTGNAATITGYVGRRATALGMGTAAIIGDNRADAMGTTMTGIGLDAEAVSSADSASIQGSVARNATATGALDATITGTVGRHAITDAGNDATITGTVGSNASATAGTDALISGDVTGNAMADAGGNATITGTVGGSASATAGDDANIDGTVIGDATATAGGNAAIGARAATTVDGTATANATNGMASIIGTVGGDADADAGMDALISGDVAGNAMADAGTTATITGTVGGDADAGAGTDALISGDVTGDAMADGGTTAMITGSVGGNADAGAGTDALISGDVTGDAMADAGGNATITGTVGGSASATAGDDANIDGTVTSDARATAGENAAIGAQTVTTVDGTATANATNGTASIIGTVGGNADADAGTDALISGDVTGNAMADAGTTATIIGTVGGDAEADAGTDALISGDVTGNAMADAGGNITLASTSALIVDGDLEARADGDIRQGMAAENIVTVGGMAIIVTNDASDGVIDLGNADNNFNETLELSDARSVTISDSGGFRLVGSGADHDNPFDAGAGTGYVIADSTQNGPGEWTLHSAGGRLLINAPIDSETPLGGNLNLSGTDDMTTGPGSTLIQISEVLGGSSRLGDVTITGARDVVFGIAGTRLVSADELADPLALETLEMLANTDYVIDTRNTNDIFFSDTLMIEGGTGSTLIIVPASLEQVFDSRDEYFGLSILEANGFSYTGAGTLDLFGELGTIRSSAAGLSANASQSGRSRFNNCLIGDPNSCSALTQANVLRLVDLAPELVFVLDEDQIEQLFLSFGNEELWGLPSVFSTDISDEDDDDEDEDEPANSNETEGEQVSSLEVQ